MREYLEELCDGIDAAVFSGDVLYSDDERKELAEYIARWSNAIDEHEAIAAAKQAQQAESDLLRNARQLVKDIKAKQAEPVAADPAVAAIQFALETHSDGLHFLRLWNEGEFDLLRREWPEAPEDIYIGADPLLEAPAQPPAVAGAVPDERAAFEVWLQENIDDTDTVRPSKEKVDAYFAVWLARAMLAAAQKGRA